MVIEKGEKIHVMFRVLFENSIRRHFLGEVTSVDGAICRLEGFVFLYDQKSTGFIRKPEKRTTIIDAADSGYITNIIDANVNIENVIYKYEQGVGLVATDNNGFLLNINEFGTKS